MEVSLSWPKSGIRPHRYYPFLLDNLRLSKMTLPLQVTWILLIILTCTGLCMASLNVTYEWKYIEYARDSCIDEEAYSIAMQSYDYTEIVPIDIQPLPDGRVLVTTPRFLDNPASLSTISNRIGKGGPLLAPYPNWTWHNRKDCSGITSVLTLFLDDCNRLWLVDSGKIENNQVCPAKILVFDPRTDKLIKELVIPNELTHNSNNRSEGLLEIAGVETYGKTCEKTWVYIADTKGSGLVIWDGYNIWRLEDEVYSADPDQTETSIVGFNFTLDIGVRPFYITPEGFLEKRAAVFKPVSSLYTYAVSLEDLHYSKLGLDLTYYRTEYQNPSLEYAGAYSKRGGVLIFNLLTETALLCWNLQYPVLDTTVPYLVVDRTKLQYVTAIKTTEDSVSGSQKLWVLSNKRQRFKTNTVDFTETNFRIMTSDLDALVRGTPCEPLARYNVEDGIEDKEFFFYKTGTDDLYNSFRLHHDTDSRGNGSVSGPLEECDVENGIDEEEFHETPTNTPSKTCRLVRI